MAKFIKVIEVYGRNLQYKREVWFNAEHILMLKDLKKQDPDDYSNFEKITCIAFVDSSRSSSTVLHTPEEILAML